MILFTQQMTKWITEAMKSKQEMPSIHSRSLNMDTDDAVVPRLVIVDEEMDTSDEQARLSKQKLVDTLSFSFPGESLASALAKVKDDEDLLTQSCFSQIRLDKGRDEFEDDELTSLSWLQDKNLLKNISGSTRLCPSPLSSDQGSSEDDYESGKENDSLSSSFSSSNSPSLHPSHIPYNPQKHVNSKPPYSFSCLIFMAIEDSPDKKLPVKDIYSWILNHFPYFQNAPTGWKNSVRHNLSLNKCFQKVDKDKISNIGKGSYWCIDPDYRPNLLQALRKTPYHPYHQLQMTSSSPIQFGSQKFPLHGFRLGSNLSPHLFPFLSKRFNTGQPDVLESDIDVANALVSLKKSPLTGHISRQSMKMRSLNLDGQRSRSPSPPEFGSAEDRGRTTNRSRRVRAKSPIIVTEVPSEDHTYSTTTVHRALLHSPDSSSIDGEYEFHDSDVEHEDELASGDEFDSEEEAEMILSEVDKGKEMDGVNALLNLASIAASVLADCAETPATSSLSASKITKQQKRRES